MARSETDLHDTLKEGGRSVAGDSGGSCVPMLVVVEVALAMVVSIGAGLLVRSFVGLMRVDPGFSSERLLTGMAGLVDVKAEKRAALVAAMLEHIERVHGVETAGAGTGLPPRDSAALHEIRNNRPDRPSQNSHRMRTSLP